MPVCVCVGIYFGVHPPKSVPGGEQEVGSSTCSGRITGSPSKLENTKGKKKSVYLYGICIYIFIYIQHINISHRYTPYTGKKRNIRVRAFFFLPPPRVFIYLNDLRVSDYCFECVFGPQLQAPRRVRDIYDKPRVPFKASLVMFNL